MAVGTETFLQTRYRYGRDIAPLADGEGIWTARSSFAEPVALHDHDFLEVELIEAGSADHVTIHGRERVSAGQITVVHPGQWHGYDRPRGLALRDVYIDSRLFARELAWLRDDQRLWPLVPLRMPRSDRERRATPQGLLSLRGDARWFADVTSACDAIDDSHGGGAPRHRGALIARLLLLFDRLADHPELRRRSARRIDTRVAVILDAMQHDLSRTWSNAVLAQHAGLSEPHLVRMVRLATGHAPMQWLTHRRAERLAVLLLGDHRPVGQLGCEVGWSNASHCARRFRDCFGCSPAAYRRQRGVQPGGR